MNIRHLMATFLLLVSAGIATAAFSADEDEVPVFGRQLMTEQERNEHRERMRNAVNDEERELLRQQHHERMVIRARERGVELPDMPPMRGRSGMGPGAGMGSPDGMRKNNR